jgi:predicted O-methyltransferase YrrM
MLGRLFGKGGDARTSDRERISREQLAHFPMGRLTERGSGAAGWPFPPHLDNPACRWLGALKHVYSLGITFPASLSPEAGQLLHALALNSRPRVVVETGVFLGISTIWLAAALELAGGEGVVHCVDDFRPIRKGKWRAEEMLDGREAVFRKHIAMAGLERRVIVHVGESAAGVASVAEKIGRGRGGKPGGVQFAFLDADHSIEGVRREFSALEPALDTGGYVVLHDTYPEISRWKGPRQLMDEVNGFAAGTYECMDLYLAPTNFGLGVMRRVG